MLGANSDESALSCSVLPFLSTAVETCKYSSQIPSWLTHILTKRKIALISFLSLGTGCPGLVCAGQTTMVKSPQCPEIKTLWCP